MLNLFKEMGDENSEEVENIFLYSIMINEERKLEIVTMSNLCSKDNLENSVKFENKDFNEFTFALFGNEKVKVAQKSSNAEKKLSELLNSKKTNIEKALETDKEEDIVSEELAGEYIGYSISVVEKKVLVTKVIA